MQITTDSAQCYPGYVARGEVRASKDAISEIAGKWDSVHVRNSGRNGLA